MNIKLLPLIALGLAGLAFGSALADHSIHDMVLASAIMLCAWQGER